MPGFIRTTGRGLILKCGYRAFMIAGVDSAIIGGIDGRKPARRPAGVVAPSHVLSLPDLTGVKKAITAAAGTRLRPTFNGPQEIAAQMSLDLSPDVRSRLPNG